MAHFPRPRVLSIQSEVAFGHVGNSAARFALQRLGVDVMALPTVLFSNHPGHNGMKGQPVAPGLLDDLLTGLDERGFLDGVDAVISGYLGDPAQAEIVRRAVTVVKGRNPGALYLLDPVFGDEGGAYAKPGIAEAMARQLLPLADIVTPNRFELASLTSQKVETAPDAAAAARLLGRPLVLATSAPAAVPDRIGTMAVTAGEAFLVTTARVEHPPSGTGDLLASLFLGRRLKGADIADALSASVASVDHMIRAAKAGDLSEMPLVAEQKALSDPEIGDPPQLLA
ncbi:MAG: pyridoxal kinase [Micropepsaceae bacterium]